MLSVRKMQLCCGNVLSIVTEAKSLIAPETNAAQCGVRSATPEPVCRRHATKTITTPIPRYLSYELHCLTVSPSNL